MSELVSLSESRLGFEGFIKPRDIYQAMDESFQFFIHPATQASSEQTPEHRVAVSKDLDVFLLGRSFEEVIEYNISMSLKSEYLRRMKYSPARTCPPSLVDRVVPCLEQIALFNQMIDRSFTNQKLEGLRELEEYQQKLYDLFADLTNNQSIIFLREFQLKIQGEKNDFARAFLLEELDTLRRIREKAQYGSC